VKVEDSMENLEEVVKERNRAYYELETGTTGSVYKSFSCFFSNFIMQMLLLESRMNANPDPKPIFLRA
jgi:hypothetical protein